MTVSYQYDVASSSTGGFFRLLWRWRGSIWKLLYKELLLFIAIYISIALTYDFLMPDYYKRYYERIVIFCSAFVEIIPLSFILGFYVSFTATRWWQQYTAIPWPDKLMNIIALYVPGADETSRILRRTLMRYLNLTLVLVLRSISIPVKRRFPTKDHLVEAGFMTKPELEMYSSVPSHEFNTFWIPCTWFVNLLREAKSECRITDSGGLKLIMEEFNDFRSKCGLLWSYDWVSIPLVYTQVVTLSTQAFFLASLLGRQHINPPASEKLIDHQYGEYYFPIFTLLQFILYMGLLKLGEQLINPFGDDDEDFELNWIIDRHVKVSFLGVDILNADPPPLIKDNYFDDTDIKLPYTQAAVAHKVKTYRGSVAAFHVPMEKQGLVIPEFEDENDNDSDDASTVQSSQLNPMRSSVWNVFSKKPKLNESQSIPSIDSETMVECGLNPLWKGSVASIYTNQTETTTVTTGYGTDRSSQGITRGKNEDSKSKEFIIEIPTDMPSGETTTGGGDTPTSSIDLPLLYRELGSSASKLLPKNNGSRKSSFPIGPNSGQQIKCQSVQQIIDPNVVDVIQVRRAHSTANKRMKPKSMIKGSRIIDPKLKIRPFKSRVTFSEDTKSSEKSNIARLIYYMPKAETSNSSLDLNEILETDSRVVLTDSSEYPTTHLTLQIPEVIDKRNDSILRRQSLDPTIIIIPEAGTSQEEEKWLHHQSLPNIQEGQEDETINELTVQTTPILARKVSVKRHTSDRTTERRKSFKRQESCSCHESHQNKEIVENNKHSEETNKHDLTNATNFKKKRKEPKPRQSSTESDTGSYHTASSFLMQISEDSEDVPQTLKTNSNSSIDSYTSATDEPKTMLTPTELSTFPAIRVTTQSTPPIISLSSNGQNVFNGNNGLKRIPIEENVLKKCSKESIFDELSEKT